jgi:DNA-binding LytR/AlgR family response regulator
VSISNSGEPAEGSAVIRYASLDDEPPAHLALRALLAAHPDLVDAGAYGSAAAARAGLQRQPVDLLFLDFRLVGSTGFDFLASLESAPVTVLFTAHADHAVAAFERGVRDYLLKPVRAERLALCLSRIRALLRGEATSGARGPRPAALPFFCGRGYRLLAPEEILAIDAEGNFSWIVTATERILASESLKALEARLGLFGFLRIHKGHLIHRRHLRGFDSREVQLTHGLRRPIGRMYRSELDALLR